MPIKSFRGQLAHDTIDLISLHTNDGSTGYRIKKLELLQTDANEADEEETSVTIGFVDDEDKEVVLKVE